MEMTKTSYVVKNCQICQGTDLKSVLFLGYLPPVNLMPKIGVPHDEMPSYPAEMLICKKCQLVQLGSVVNSEVLFPESYPYTSSTTKILRENFAELYTECSSLVKLSKDDLIVDIGSNDGNLLSNFQKNHKVQGVTPEDIGKIAIERGIPTIQAYFSDDVASLILKEKGKAKIVTATNVFAHIDSIHDIVKAILKLMPEDGVFISESHYLLPLVETLQYDTIYHEHLRYYSLTSLKYLFDMHGLEIFHAKRIPTHGGSVRVYTARKGQYPVKPTVQELLASEDKAGLNTKGLSAFRDRVIKSKVDLLGILRDIRLKGQKVYGISAPSRASTLVNYVGLDDGLMDCVLEIKGSHKIGKYMPGTAIPVLEEEKLFNDQPEYALMLSWHIADELIPKLKAKGYRGKFIVPLPTPQVVS
jgi:hypothetical protein